ncbi:MAG: MBL fold metallo-hydrolase [Patescibacteria group bacterium]|nr:MBL fold metallo-hydrolase [Patescibacteria group bacterium]MDD5164002.1 MBL fold metallo-hydrolase [Patescibacteria group bacterium]MDD5534914.1 MBL fold metallo-hydrolase [Patescibacteria group bacterium]
MKITRFAQSCVLIETKNKRILIDPGNIQYQESFLNNEWKDVDVLLITHKHADHCHIDAIKEIIKNKKTKFYTTQEVAAAYPEIQSEIIKEGDILNCDDIKIEAVKAIHGYVPFLKGDKEIKENVGYIIDDGACRVYQTSDTICFNNNYKCDVLFVPVCDHGLVMGPYEAALFTKETGAKLVVPIHYDNPKYPADFERVKKEFEAQDLNFKFLTIGESFIK